MIVSAEDAPHSLHLESPYATMTSSRLLLLSAFVLSVFVGTAQAQDSPDNPVMASLKALHQRTSMNITSTAELLDQDLYAFRPTDDVRSMGQILGHVADAQYQFCSAAADEDNPHEGSVEETVTDKAEMVAALQAAFAYCEGVYDAMTDAQGAEMRQFIGEDMVASGVLAFNSAHNFEHYGNLVTYMRLNGIVPPSSR